MKGGLDLPILRVALYEGSGAMPLDDAQRFELMQTLLDKGYRVTRVAAGGAPVEADGHALVIVGRFAGDHPTHVQNGDTRIYLHDIEGLTTAQTVELVEGVCRTAGLREPGGWKPWFPVIDYDRCTNCMQCLSFCLFDVYGVSEAGKIQVQKQDNCKTDCPACSRVCPEVAILFPKYKHGPIHGGEVNSEDLRREAMKVDISALLGGDIYQALRDRSVKAKSRFSKERDEDRALKERKRCLTKLQADLDIPAEVFASLPSLDEIQEKARHARERALAAAGGER